MEDKTLQAVIKLKDEMSSKLKGIQKSLSGFQKSVSQTSKTISGMQRIMNKIKPLLLKAKDKVSPILNQVKGKLKAIGSKAWTAVVKAKDMASSVLGKIKGLLAGLAAGVTIGVKVGLEGLVQEQNNKITIDRVLKNSGLKDYKKVGEEYYKYLEDYANKTPFTTAEMATAGTKAMMMAKGDTNQAKQITDMIANTKAFVGDNRTMQEVIDAYFSAKNGNMESLNNILGEDYQNWDQASADILKKYGGLVEEQSKTIGGLFSTIKGKLGVMLKDMMKPFEGFLTGGMQNLIGFFDSIAPKLQDFAQKVADGFKAFSESQMASDLLQLFQTVATTVWNGIKAVIDAVSPTIKEIFIWIGEHSNTISALIQTLGNIWNTVWSAVGPILQTAWNVIRPILDAMAKAIEIVCGAINGLITGFKNLVSVFKSGDVQEALSNSKAANGNHAAGLQRVPFDGYRAVLHQGEAVLPRRDADQWRKGKTNSPNISIVMNGTVIREEQDVKKIAAELVRKINQQKIIIG